MLKREPTADEVMSAFEGDPAPDRPIPISHVLMWLAGPDVDSAAEARSVVSDAAVRRVLQSLVAQGRLHEHLGRWWARRGVRFYGQGDHVFYWCTPKLEQRLHDQAVQRWQAATIERAKQWASAQLAAEYASRFRELTDQWLAEHADSLPSADGLPSAGG